MSIEAVERLRHILTEAELAVPPIPRAFAEQLIERESWHFATRAIGLSPYNLDRCVEQSSSRACEDYLLVAHAGHGANSYALHYYLVWRPLRLFVQVGWGGVYMGDHERRTVRECIALLDPLLAAFEQARSASGMPPHVLVVVSDFYPDSCRAPGHDQSYGVDRTSESPSDFTPQRVLVDATRWLLDRGMARD